MLRSRALSASNRRMPAQRSRISSSVGRHRYLRDTRCLEACRAPTGSRRAALVGGFGFDLGRPRPRAAPPLIAEAALLASGPWFLRSHCPLSRLGVEQMGDLLKVAGLFPAGSRTRFTRD